MHQSVPVEAAPREVSMTALPWIREVRAHGATYWFMVTTPECKHRIINTWLKPPIDLWLHMVYIIVYGQPAIYCFCSASTCTLWYWYRQWWLWNRQNDGSQCLISIMVMVSNGERWLVISTATHRWFPSWMICNYQQSSFISLVFHLW